MEKDGWKKWEGKKVFIKLRGGRVYTGVINHVENGNMLSLTDKFERSVMIAISEIALINEEAFA